jgi:hypothetical protein
MQLVPLQRGWAAGASAAAATGVHGGGSGGPLLNHVLAVLAGSSSVGAWRTAIAAAGFLVRATAAAPALAGRGVFVLAVGAIHVECPIAWKAPGFNP